MADFLFDQGKNKIVGMKQSEILSELDLKANKQEVNDILYNKIVAINANDSGIYEEDPATVSFAHAFNFISGKIYHAKLKIIKADFLTVTDAIRIQQSTSTGTGTSYIISNSYVFRLNASELHDGDIFETDFEAKENCVNLLSRYKFSSGNPSIELEVSFVESIKNDIENINQKINYNFETLNQNCRMLMGAHRGAEHFAPPNCVAAYEIAGKMGFPWAWIAQVRYSLNNTLYVMHDEDVSITTNGTGNISELTDEYIDSLLCNKLSGYDYSLFTNDDLKVPTLEKTIQICLRYGMKMCFRIEPLPNDMENERRTEIWNNFKNLIKNYGISSNDATYSGYNPNEMRLCIQLLGDVEICPYISGASANDYIQWFEERPEFTKKAILKSASSLTLEDIKLLHANDIKVYAFTNSTTPTMEQMINLANWGADILQNPIYSKIPLN